MSGGLPLILCSNCRARPAREQEQTRDRLRRLGVIALWCDECLEPYTRPRTVSGVVLPPVESSHG